VGSFSDLAFIGSVTERAQSVTQKRALPGSEVFKEAMQALGKGVGTVGDSSVIERIRQTIDVCEGVTEIAITTNPGRAKHRKALKARKPLLPTSFRNVAPEFDMAGLGHRSNGSL